MQTVGSGVMSFPFQQCPHCGWWHAGVCARVKAIEYHPDGTVKRVEYHDSAGAGAAALPVVRVLTE
jgi:hypothetical protein